MQNHKIKAGVIGDPIMQSLSPKIHNFFLKKYNIEGSYEAIQVKKENLLHEVQSLMNQGFAGFNVTIPHKEEIFKICDFKSKTAALTGAVNTVIITEDKKLFGHNSDAEGFLNNLKEQQPQFDLKDKNIFIIGGGGAARAVVYAVIKAGAKKVFITNRNAQRIEKLIADFKKFSEEKSAEIIFCDMNNFTKKLEFCDLLVNASSLGMTGQEKLIIDLKNLKKSAIVYDIVYKPLMTDLLKSSQECGNQIVTGIGMLINQALIGFEAWFKQKPEVDSKLLNELL